MEDWIGRGTVVTRVNSDIGIAITKKLVDMGMIVVGLDTHTECHEVIILFIKKKIILSVTRKNFRKIQKVKKNPFR